VARIKALAIPPAWADVWICRYPSGHIQDLRTWHGTVRAAIALAGQQATTDSGRRRAVKKAEGMPEEAERQGVLERAVVRLLR
jgi:DNA topoisomerase IB